MLQDNLVLYFMTKANIQSYVKDTKILVRKKRTSEVCQNLFLQCVSRYLYTGSVNFCPRKLQLSFTFRRCWIVRCALLSSLFHPVHAERNSRKTSILRFHVVETADCHLQEPRDKHVWLLINYNPLYGGEQEKSADISWQYETCYRCEQHSSIRDSSSSVFTSHSVCHTDTAQ